MWKQPGERAYRFITLLHAIFCIFDTEEHALIARFFLCLQNAFTQYYYEAVLFKNAGHGLLLYIFAQFTSNMIIMLFNICRFNIPPPPATRFFHYYYFCDFRWRSPLLDDFDAKHAPSPHYAFIFLAFCTARSR